MDQDRTWVVPLRFILSSHSNGEILPVPPDLPAASHNARTTTQGNGPELTESAAITKQCLSCNYSLEGLPEEGVCPECGLVYGTDLVLVGYRSIPADTPSVILTLIVLFAGGFLFLVYGNFCCGLPIMGIMFWYLFNQVQLYRSREAIGGDLRWVVNAQGIRVVRGKATQIPLLPWSEIRTIKTRGNLGFRTRRWRTLIVRRRAFSLDWVHIRAQQIWLEKIDPRAMKELRDKVLSYRE